MRIAEFLVEHQLQPPLIQDGRSKDVKKFIFKKLDDFVSELRKLDVDFSDSHFPSYLILERQTHLVNKIKDAYLSSYNGKPAEAYALLKEGLESGVKNFREVLNIKEYAINSDFYRIRLCSENYPLALRDFFHIPFELRGQVKTQRFSIPGFPSLYLGNSLYVCWEELRRPRLNDFQAVRLQLSAPIRTIDLSPPDINNASSGELYNYLMVYPLVLACSIKVRHLSNTFKAEYIIPQLLLQWVRESDDIDGITYRTTHIDFSKSDTRGNVSNTVLPVKENNDRGHCKGLL